MAEEEGRGNELPVETKFVPKEMKEMVNYVRGFQFVVEQMKSPAQRAIEGAIESSIKILMENLEE